MESTPAHSKSFSVRKNQRFFLARRLRHMIDLLHELIVRDMKLRYKRSKLGLIWSLFNPLSQVIVLSIVFRFILPTKIPNFTVFLFTGVLVWSWFSTSLHAATVSIVNNGMLIRRPGFPIVILPIVTVSTNLIHFLLYNGYIICIS